MEENHDLFFCVLVVNKDVCNLSHGGRVSSEEEEGTARDLYVLRAAPRALRIDRRRRMPVSSFR